MFDIRGASGPGMNPRDQVLEEPAVAGSPGGEGTECEGMEVTFCTRIRDEQAYPALDAIADLWCRLQRRLFVDLYVRGGKLGECKKRYIARYGLTARRFNALSADLRGKVKARREAVRAHVAGLERRVRVAREKIARLEKELSKASSPERRRRLEVHPPPEEAQAQNPPGPP